jgi:lipid II:glycine glycyltransferase (peptidoglycan interpeptide bridge formation enzyme)
VTDLTLHIIDDRARWNDALRALPYAHILQSWEWGDFKQRTTGWTPLRAAWQRDGQIVALASVGARRAGGLTVMYAPKGPALAYHDAALAETVLFELERLARRRGALWLKIDPDLPAATGIPGEADDTPDEAGTAFMARLRARRWRFSADQVQFRNTITLDLTRSEDDLLAAMSQTTRRKVRIAEREGVSVRPGTADDLPLLYQLYQVTGARDQFLIRPAAYYEDAWRSFIAAGLAQPLIAEYHGRAIAHVILFHFGRTCWYMYGASGDEHREVMPNYLLQWRAIQWAKAHGCAVYDLWGAPDVFDESDRMYGVFGFKRGFRGDVVRHIGAWDYAPFPPLYDAYTQLMPRVRGWLRGRAAKRDTITTQTGGES